MKRKPRRRGPAPGSRSLLSCLRQFLTPAAWKQAHQASGRRRRSPRWPVQALLLVVLFTAWCCGDSQAERFETARAFAVACLPKRKRPGRTVGGFHKALARLPSAALRALAQGVRDQLPGLLGPRWGAGGWVGLGCDGGRVECPRSAELEQRLGQAGKDQAAPALWVTALVHLGTGLLWAWRLGLGTASERAHLVRLLPLLPGGALLVADAGFLGFDLVCQLVGADVCFLLRLSSKVPLYRTRHVRLERFREGQFLYWTKKARAAGRPPVLVRVIRLRAKKRKHDVWLLTNVLDGRRLSAAEAGAWYRRRWENEGLFRTYKRTLKKVKLSHRTVRLVHREAEGSLLALQLLLAQGALALRPCRDGAGERLCSPRKVVLAVRAEMQARLQRGHVRYYERLQEAERERRERRSAKEKRVWPRRKPHKQPGPPKFLTLTEEDKALISRLKTHPA